MDSYCFLIARNLSAPLMPLLKSSPADVVGEAWRQAEELQANVDILERMLEARRTESRLQGKAATADAPGSRGGTESEEEQMDWEALWSKQQGLWRKSRELWKEGPEMSFTKP